MRTHDAGGRQLVIEGLARAERAQEPEARPRPGRAPTRPLASSATADQNVYGDDFALIRVRDGFYSDERRVYYVSRGRVYLVGSPRMRPGHGFRRISALPGDAVAVDESSFDPDDSSDQALFAVADCIDGIV